MAGTVALDTLSTKELQVLSGLLKQDILKAPLISTYTKIFPNIPYATYINIYDKFGTLVGVADTGCGASVDTNSITPTKKTWSPKAWIADLKECYINYDGTLIEPQMNVLPDRADLMRTELMDFLAAEYKVSLEEMLFRFLWFNDTDAALCTASPAGVLTAGTATKYFTVYDGYFRQLYDICTSDPTRRVTIAANAEATAALQDSALTPTLAYGYLMAMTYNCDNTVKANAAGYKILCTQEMYDKAKQYVQGTGIPNMFIYMENGVQTLRINGYEVVPMPLWSQYIRAYEDNGTKYHDPHRAVMMNPNNFGIAVPKSDIVLLVDVWYDKLTRYNYLRSQGVMDMKIIFNKQVMFAY